MTDLLTIKDQVSQQQLNEYEETSSIVNEIKTTSFPSSEITITTERLEIESVPLTTSSTLEKTTATETMETDFPSAISNTFLIDPPASETNTLMETQHKEIPSISLETEPQTTKKNEVDSNIRMKGISIDSVDQDNSMSDIIFPTSFSSLDDEDTQTV